MFPVDVLFIKIFLSHVSCILKLYTFQSCIQANSSFFIACISRHDIRQLMTTCGFLEIRNRQVRAGCSMAVRKLNLLVLAMIILPIMLEAS